MAAEARARHQKLLGDLVHPSTYLEKVFKYMVPSPDRCTTAAEIANFDDTALDLDDPEIPNELLRETCFRKDRTCCESLCASTGMRCHNKAAKQVTVRVTSITSAQSVPMRHSMPRELAQPEIRAGDTIAVLVCDAHYRIMLRAEHGSTAWSIARFVIVHGINMSIQYVIVPQVVGYAVPYVLPAVSGLAGIAAQHVPPRALRAYHAIRATPDSQLNVAMQLAYPMLNPANIGQSAANLLDRSLAPSVMSERSLSALAAHDAPAALTGYAPQPSLFERRAVSQSLRADEVVRKRGREGADIAAQEAEKASQTRKLFAGRGRGRSRRRKHQFY
jgi:hypothetical protein